MLRSLSSLLFVGASVAFPTQQQYLGIQSHSQNYKFDPLLHLPGISPYFDAIGFGLEHKAPQGCEIYGATYLIRHAAIYANDYDYETFVEPFLKKINASSDWTGPLAFIKQWKNPIDNPEKQMEQITPGGIEDSIKVGLHLLKRYPHILPTMKKIYADKKARTQDTAKAFIRAFPQDVKIVQIHTEDEFHSQVPHKACSKFTKNAGDDEFHDFVQRYTKNIISRLKQFAPNNDLTPFDIVGMQQLCGYESAITGYNSDFCDVFMDMEWMNYEYAWDLKYYYMVGHGNNLSQPLGWPWVNNTAYLLNNLKQKMDANELKDSDERFFMSFTHREVPPFIATALGLFNSSNSDSEAFPTTEINFSRSWKMAELIPFLGHIGVEVMKCSETSGAVGKGDDYIRVIANSAPRPIPGCEGGPGGTCKMDKFLEIGKAGMEKYGDFHKYCGKKTKKEKPGKGKKDN